MWCPTRIDIAFLAATGAAMAAALAGCGDSDDLPRQPVSGRVTFDGQPLTKAWIQFRPAGNAGITASGAMIENGGYAIPRSDGLIPGNYQVIITKAEEPDSSAGKPEAPAAPKASKKTLKLQKGFSPFGFAKQLIPAQYNVKTQLTAKVEEGQTKDFDFDLNSK